MFTLNPGWLRVGVGLAVGSTGSMDLTDARWERIAPLMPRPRGNCKLSPRQVLDGWLFITWQGCTWRSLPERYGPWFMVYMRGKRWAERSVLARVFAELQRIELEVEPPAARVHLDSTIVKVHQDGTGAPRQRGGQALGRSRGGLTTKLHAIVRAGARLDAGRASASEPARGAAPSARPRRPPGQKSGRTVLQPAQALPRHRHPLPQTRRRLPCT